MRTVKMSSFLLILFIVALIAFQSFAGYKQNKYLGAIIPVVFCAIVLYLMVMTDYHWNFRNIVMPMIGLVSFIGIYNAGSESKKKKLQQELDKMKAKDSMKK